MVHSVGSISYPQQRRGRFVVLEGLSAVGKTTVAPVAARLLGAELVPTLPHWLAETRIHVDAARVAAARLHFWMMCNYAAADIIEAALTAGRDVVVESYFYRTLATHQAIGVGRLPEIDWRAAPSPDLAMLLTVDQTVRQERLDLRRGTPSCSPIAEETSAMLDTAAGVTHIRMLYLQLLYRCNFSCKHCFHGDLLADPDTFTPAQAIAMIDHFQATYSPEAVTLLGGEPLLYPDLPAVALHAQSCGLGVEICTNGHPGFRERLRQVAPYLDKLRVSLDGLNGNHDRIRQRGSFDGALQTIDFVNSLGVPTGATMTVTDRNLVDVVSLAKLLDSRGVTELKLHCLRIVGNAIAHADMQVPEPGRYPGLHQAITSAGLSLTVLYDSDLSPMPRTKALPRLRQGGRIDRTESDPRGGLTFSCRASGHNINSFRWDKEDETIHYEPTNADELATGVDDVIYHAIADERIDL